MRIKCHIAKHYYQYRLLPIPSTFKDYLWYLNCRQYQYRLVPTCTCVFLVLLSIISGIWIVYCTSIDWYPFLVPLSEQPVPRLWHYQCKLVLISKELIPGPYTLSTYTVTVTCMYICILDRLSSQERAWASKYFVK